MRAVDSHECLGTAVGEGLETASVIFEEAEVLPLQIDRPGIDVGCAVFNRELHRVANDGVAPHFDAGIVPPEEMMASVAVIGQSHMLFEQRASGTQNDLYRPIHAVYAIAIAHRHRGAAIGRSAVGPVNRGDSYPVMRDREVEFFAERRPCAAIGDDGFLERWIGVEHRLPVDLVNAGVDVAAELGKDGALEVFVFKIECVPRTNRFRGANVLPHGVGVVFELGEVIEVRVLVGRAFVGCRQRHDSFPHLYLAVQRQGTNEKRNPEQQCRTHTFSLVRQTITCCL